MEDSLKNRYYGIDGIKAWSCLGIIAMHIMANTDYKEINGIPREIIKSWTELVYLFLIVSAFGLCCGYYERFHRGDMNINDFYKRRYKKNLPFFLLLIFIAIILNRTKDSLIEGFIESTLLFGFLPNNNLDLLGVSWTLGVIFVFYIFFPFFCGLICNKKSGLFFFIISIIINYVCSEYFFSSRFVVEDFPFRHNFLYCLPFFFCGGVIFLFKDEICNWIKKHRCMYILITILITICYYIVPDYLFSINIFVIKQLIVMSIWVMFAMGCNNFLLSNRLIKYLSKISMEMYLAQMVIFRLIEKTGILYYLGEGYKSFLFIFILEILGLVIFIKFSNFAIDKLFMFRKKLL